MKWWHKAMVWFGFAEEEESQSVVEDKVKPSRRNLVTLPGGSLQKVALCRPSSFEEAETMAHYVKNRRVVILSLENLTDPGEAQKVLTFMSGLVYGIEGDMRKIAGGVFVLAPPQCEIVEPVMPSSIGSRG